MNVTTRYCGIFFVVLSFFLPTTGFSQTRADVEAKIKKAVEQYDEADFDGALVTLNQGLAIARKGNLESDSVTAQVYLQQGIIYFGAKENPESARLAFINAVQIDPTITISKLYARPDMVELLDEVKAKYSGTGEAQPKDCNFTGMRHSIIDEMEGGEDQTVSAHVSPALKATAVILYFRPRGVVDYLQEEMAQTGKCGYSAKIRGRFVRGTTLHYYIVAYRKNKVVAESGSPGSPNPVMVSSSSGEPDTTKPSPPKEEKDDHPSVFFFLGGGSGVGLATGNTEQRESPLTGPGGSGQGGFAPAWLHLAPELGVYLSEQLAISLALRLGFTLTANIPGHETTAPAVLFKFRYRFSPKPSSFYLNGATGFGFFRQVIELSDGSGEIDTTVSGPFALGIGFGFEAAVSESVRFVLGVDGYAGIPVTSPILDVEPFFGTQFDFTTGLLLAF